MPKLHLYFHTPVPVFKARVNMASVTYPVSAITYDNVSLGSYTDIQFDMTLLLGTTEGADDLGRVRVQKPAAGDTIYVARSSRGFEDGQLDVEDDAYITVLEDYRVWARLPYFNLVSGIDYKDGDVEVNDYNTELPPIANAGSGVADYIDSGTGVITVEFPNDGVNVSRAMADGATLATYAWDVGDGTITVGTAADAVITATFPAGFRYVSLTVTDSNGVPHTARTPVLAVDPDDDPTVRSYQISQTLEWQGQILDVNIHDEMGRTDYPDGTLVMFWWDGPASPDDRSHMKFVGWVDNESYSIGRSQRGLVKRTTLRCVDVCGRLAALPGFPQALSRIEDESPWSYMPSLDMNKCLWYLGFWHSTAINLADFILPEDGDNYDAMRLDSGAASLYEQMSQQSQKMVPDHYFVCTAKGQMIFQKDWRLEDVGDRPTAAPIITEDYWNDLQIEYSRHPKVHVLRSGAILSSTALDDDDLIPVVFSIAPSDAEAFGQGVQEQIESEGLALSQEALNKSEGHRYAMLNSRYGDFSLRDPSGFSFWDYEPALFNRVQLNIPADLAAQRGLDFTQASGLVKSVNVQYQTDKRGTVIKPSVVWMKETSGYPALTHIPEEVDDIGYTPPTTTPPDFGFTPDQESVAAIDEDGTLYRTTDFQTPDSSGGPTWTQHSLGIADNKVYSFVVDPFSPGYIEGTGSIDGWVVTESDIYRIEDMFGTPSATSVHTFAYAIDHTDKRQTRTIQASFGAYFAEGSNPWLLVVSHYGDTSGHTGTWALRSLNGGVTWETEAVITAEYDNGGLEQHIPNEVGVYTSPKTPGYAITTAYNNTISIAQASEYFSEDWGETWTKREPADDSNELPIFIYNIDNEVSNVDIGDYSWNQIFASSDGDGAVLGRILVAPPANSKQITIVGSYVNHIVTNSASTYASDHSTNKPAGFNILSTTKAFVTGTTQIDWEQVVEINDDFLSDWFRGKEDYYADLPTLNWGGYFGYDFSVTAGGFLGAHTTNLLTVRFRITEIVRLDDSTYVPSATGVYLFPGMRLSAAIHVPWQNNSDESVVYSTNYAMFQGQEYRVYQAPGAGAALVELSTSNYGPVRSGFGLRAYDSDRNYMVMGGAENEGSYDQDDTQHAVLVSNDAGATWTSILGPTAETSFTGKRGYSAAFSGTDPDIIYIWGAPDGVDGCIAFSDDFGVTVDSREGNLGSFGISSFLGIAGGPTGG